MQINPQEVNKLIIHCFKIEDVVTITNTYLMAIGLDAKVYSYVPASIRGLMLDFLEKGDHCNLDLSDALSVLNCAYGRCKMIKEDK
jgi:hypothetical protein